MVTTDMAKRRKTNKKQILIFAIIAVLFMVSVVITYFPGKVFPTWSSIYRYAGVNETASTDTYPFMVSYLDVGQADCELINCGGKAVLIDSGYIDAYDKVAAYLNALDIKKIDYFILTHAHSDHIGSAAKIIQNFEITNIIMPRYTEQNMPDTNIYTNLLQTISESGATAYAATPGDRYDLNGFCFSVLAPNADYDELNNSSVVIKATYGKNSFLFMGDAEKKSEKDILNAGFDVSADVIKLGHHGSKTSSSEVFLKSVNPTLAIISCGVNNQYNLPSEKTLDMLDKLGIQYKRTDVSGTIVVGSDGEHIYVSTEK